jgi:hypothetical protein
MKYLILFFCISTFSSAIADIGAMIGIDSTQGSSDARVNVFTSKDLIGYSLGGTVYNFPSVIVNPHADPRVYVTVQLNINSSLTEPYVAVVSAINFLNATITVYRLSPGGTITEAANGEVDLNILVIPDVVFLPA